MVCKQTSPSFALSSLLLCSVSKVLGYNASWDGRVINVNNSVVVVVVVLSVFQDFQ